MDGNFRIDGNFNIFDEWAVWKGTLTPAGDSGWIGILVAFLLLILAGVIFLVYALVMLAVLGIVALIEGDYKKAANCLMIHIIIFSFYALMSLSHHLTYEWNHAIAIQLPPKGQVLLAKLPGEASFSDQQACQGHPKWMDLFCDPGSKFWRYAIEFDGNWGGYPPSYTLPNNECWDDIVVNSKADFYCLKRPVDYPQNVCVQIKDRFRMGWPDYLAQVCLDYTTGRFK